MLGSKHHVCESHTVLHMYRPESTPSALQQCAAPSYTLPRKPHNLIFIHISNYMYVFIYIYVCVSVCVSCPPSLKPTFLVPALESKPRRLFSISAPTPPTSVRSGYASFPCSLLLFQPTPTFRSFTLPSQVGFGSDLPGPPGPLGTGQSVQKTTPFDSGLMCNDEFSGTPTLWIFNVAMERSTMLLIGKPSISMGKKIHGYVK